jgi:molybdopterin guanine dinucleotide-containing S/N-oxide reductase-like protein
MGHPHAIDTKNGKIVRIRPLHYDEKQSWESLNPWTIEARGKSFTVPRKAPVPPYNLTFKNTLYAPDKVLYPVKRVDWEPGGDPAKVNAQNRGKSKYKRISWDEATDIIASEIKRIHDKYGLWGVLCQGDGHGESKNFADRHGAHATLMYQLGGYTLLNRNPDSWEGWVWGAKHVWGMEGVGKMTDHTNVWTDALRNTELIVDWGDGESTPWGGGMVGIHSNLLRWLDDVGIEHVFVTPGLNYTANCHGKKWVPVLPNTDTAFFLGLSHVWITEGLYDEAFVRDTDYCIGFDKWEDYVMGDAEDGVEKTPKWAAQRCGTPSYTIKALARRWADRVTSFAGSNFGPGFRGPYSSEPARMAIYSLAMQGLGNPGVYQLSYIEVGMMGIPGAFMAPGIGSVGWGGMEMVSIENPRRPIGSMGMLQEQFIPKPLYHEAILQHPTAANPVTWYCMDHCTREEQFVKFQYPKEGYSNFHMIWMSSSCITVCWQSGFLHTRALRDPSIEFVVARHMVMEDDTLYADIVLPEVHKMEVDDLMTDSNSLFNVLILERKPIEPIGEAKSGVELVGEVAKKLEKYGGIYTDAYENFTAGYTYEEVLEYGYNSLPDTAKALTGSWEDFQERQFYTFPVDPDWEARGFGGLAKFRADPETNPLTTHTGKIEFECQDIKEHMPDDRERPPVAHDIIGGPDWTHNESLQGSRAAAYPFLLCSCHPRWREHAQTNDAAWLREIPWCKLRGPDGYMYEPAWIHPTDAAAKGIVTGDIVKIYNDRGIVLGAAIVTERTMPKSVWQDHGAPIDVIRDSSSDTLGIERCGSNNMLGPRFGVSQNCTGGMASSGYLVQIEKLSLDEMEQWKKDYPDAFARKYDYDSGPCFDAWVVDEGGTK